MAKKVERIIIDTNLWISFLIKKDFRQLDARIQKGNTKLIFSVDSMDEFLSVTDRPKFKKYFRKEDLEQLIEFFDVYGEIIAVRSTVYICRDPKDNFLLSLCKASKAKYLITGDSDLLVLKQFDETKILTMAQYLKM